ncbi:hypothetical protein [Mycobacteroides abscessus]|nr:hypothetical protein [Mycobacteroides abscessus]
MCGSVGPTEHGSEAYVVLEFMSIAVPQGGDGGELRGLDKP